MKIDVHAHVLPGVDHGAKDWDTSLEMLVRSARYGVEAIIATPHHFPWEQNAVGKEICKLCKEAEERLSDKYGILMDIYPGNEIYYGVDTVEMLEKGEVLTLAGSRYVLVEFDQEDSYQTIYRAVRELRYNRYIPIIAHVERYFCMHNMERLAELKEMGALLQVNVSAFQGGLFDRRSNMTKRWMKQGVVDFIASDMHDLTERPPLSKEGLQWVHKKLHPQYQDKLLFGNAQDILHGIKA